MSSESQANNVGEGGMKQSDSKPTQMRIEELLECTICLDVPASPIHRCSNGHIVCGICSEKVAKCGLCQSKLQISVLAERISRQLNFESKCPHYESGCCNLIKSTEIKDHIPKCYYRNVLCNEIPTEACKGVSVQFGDFFRHLKEKHGYKEKLTSKKYFHLAGDAGSYALEGDKCFLMHGHICENIAYFWITILADKEKARKHMYELTLERPNVDEKESLAVCVECDFQ